MMAYAADLTRTIILKARRDTVVLVVSVTAVTFALASAIHSHPSQSSALLHQDLPHQQWTGDLADVTPTGSIPVSGEPITSASLVVPTSDFALPQVPVRALVKLRGCDGGICVPKAATAPTPVRRPNAGTDTASNHRSGPRHTKPTLISRLNPLNHLPDMSTLSRPFAVAGDTVSGWFRRF